MVAEDSNLACPDAARIAVEPAPGEVARVAATGDNPAMERRLTTVAFDLGGVLIDWNPRYLYRKLFDDPDAIEELLATVCTRAWIEAQDAGRSFAEGVAVLTAQHPHHRDAIAAFDQRWDEMLGGEIPGTVAILEALDRRGVPLYALSNWPAEKFHHARARYGFLDRFRAIILSGQEKVIKPEPRIFEILLSRHQIAREALLFIDDVERNVAAARALGIEAVRFRDPAGLRADLVRLGLL